MSAAGVLFTMLGTALDALMLIAQDGCEHFDSRFDWRCSDADSGRTRGARYLAEAWCQACIAQNALTKIQES